MESNDSLQQLNLLADEIGELVYNWGFKRVHGRIWTHLFLSNRPLDASDLVKRLDISKALISISLRELIDLKLIAEIGKSPKGTHLYRTNPDLVRVFLNVLKFREKNLFSKVNDAYGSIENMSEEDKAKSELSEVRISEFKKLVANADATLDQIINLGPKEIEQWQNVFAPVENEKITAQEKSNRNLEDSSDDESKQTKVSKTPTSVKTMSDDSEAFKLSPGLSLAKGSGTIF